MRLKSLSIHNYPPLRQIDLDDLGDIVVIAGANGSGKSRLKEAITQIFREPGGAIGGCVVEATRPRETELWGAPSIAVTKGKHCAILQKYMQTRTSGGAYVGTIIQIDSNRSIQNISYPQLNLSTPDPDDEEWDNYWYLSSFAGRWQNIVNQIYQKYANRDQSIAKWVKENPERTGAEAMVKYPDPFLPYQDIFSKLLPNKKLSSIDPKSPREFHYTVNGSTTLLPFSSLSSGEQEVVRIVFDLLRKKITHCIIVIDEPEVHLHPALTFRLIETLKDLGDRSNQYIFLTHSTDLISTYYPTGSVFFINGNKETGNQGERLSDVRGSHSELAELMSQHLGVFAVGKRIIFVEGKDASRDRIIYNSIAQKHLESTNVVPVGSVENIMLLKTISEQIRSSIYVVNFYLIRDRDGLTESQVTDLQSTGRIKCLSKRHIENYLLDPEYSAKVATRLCLDLKWRSTENIRSQLRQIAAESVGYAVSLSVKSILSSQLRIGVPAIKDANALTDEEMVDCVFGPLSQELAKVETLHSREAIKKIITDTKSLYEQSLKDDSWSSVFPGKALFNRFCSDLAVKPNAYIEAYLDESRKDDNFGPLAAVKEMIVSMQQ